MADTGGFFGRGPVGALVSMFSRGNSTPDAGAGFLGTSIPTLPQTGSRILNRLGITTNVQDQGLAQDWNDRYGMVGINTQPLMSSATDAEDPNEHPSQLRPSGATVSYFGGQSRPNYSHASGNLQSLGGMGRTVGTATMSQVENMLSAGMGKTNRGMPRHEIGEERAAAKAKGMTLAQYRNQS